jgi:hypothetical protein
MISVALAFNGAQRKQRAQRVLKRRDRRGAEVLIE